MGNFKVENRDGKQVLVIEMNAFNTQVLPYYPNYNPNEPSKLAVNDYSRPDNSVGHCQRAFIQYWALQAFLETGLIGVELGSAGVVAPMCISTDIVGNGETPEYGGTMSGVQIKLDASDLSVFQTASLSCVLSNHVLEHVPCKKLIGRERDVVEMKKRLGCNGTEILEVFRNHWLRVLVTGGYFAAVFPEEGAANRGGHSVFHHDESHQHSWYASKFHEDIIQPLVDEGLVEVIEYDTFRNNFSCNVVLRKK